MTSPLVRETPRVAHAPYRDAVSRYPELIHGALPVAIVFLAALSVRSIDLESMTDLGLVSVLPPSTIVLLLVLTCSFCLSLTRARFQRAVPLLHVLALIVMLYGVTTYLEGDPRFSVTWRHAGIIDYITRHDAVDPLIDAYFNWPGFFILGSTFTEVAGFASPIDFGAWGPLAFNLLFLAPLFVVFSWASDDARAVWLAIWLFYSTNWVGQDYISPQALGYLLWLAVLAVLLPWLTPRPFLLTARPYWGGLRKTVASWIADWRETRGSALRLRIGGRAPLVVLVLILYSAMVTGHQLTPFAAVLGVTALVLVARLSTRALPALMFVLMAVWISYMTTTYLAGHSHVLLSPLGAVTANLEKNIGSRLAGSPEHLVIVRLRIVAVGVIWGLAVAGVIRRLFAGRLDVALLAVAVSPILLPALQPYGGEMLIRVFYFTLPPVAFFLACVVFPTRDSGRGRGTTVAMSALACGLIAVFLFTRYGNERLDYFTPGDVAAVQHLYRIAPPGSVLYSGAPNLPWRERDYERYRYRTLVNLDAWADGRPRSRDLLRDVMGKTGGKPTFVIITRSTRIRAALLDGVPGALDRFAASLRRSPDVREVYRNAGASIFELIQRPWRGPT